MRAPGLRKLKRRKVMILTNKSLTAVFFAGLTILCSKSVLAAQEIQGEFLVVSSDRLGGHCFDSSYQDQFKDEIRAQIKNAAIKACAGRDFSIDNPSFSISQNHFVHNECDINFRMSGKATVRLKKRSFFISPDRTRKKI
jgi:hypothetical protein